MEAIDTPNRRLMGTVVHRTRVIMEMIKFEHTIFMMPFALMATAIASRGHMGVLPSKIGWILLAMVSARSAAMAFNRIADRDVDALNPRTASRAIPAGQLSVPHVAVFTIVCCALLVWSSAELNPLALALSPIAIAITLGYSYTKRFTALSHLVLGIALAAAPVGAWIAIRGAIGIPALWLGGAVVCWLFGFDIIYSLQDVDFDRAHGLHSMPALVGKRNALLLSRIAHIVMVGLLVGAGIAAGLGPIYFSATGLVAVLIGYEQSLVRPGDLSKINVAFFVLNGYISVALCLLTVLDIFVFKR